MTTPDAPRGGKAQGSGAGAADGRIRRTDPARSGPKRSSATAANNAAATTGLGAAPSPEATEATATDTKVSEAVARAVKAGYDVIEKNIRQGREAAERFRQGEYSIGDAPDDIEAAARRVLDLARVLSTSTFDVCERLLKELGTQTKTWSSSKSMAAPGIGFRSCSGYFSSR